MPFDYNAAKDKLTEAEKARIICIFLNMEQSVVMANTNWSAATAQMGSASVEAMKKGLTNTYKKLTKVSDGDIPAVSAATPTKKTPGRKRKAAAESVEGGDDGETPAKKQTKFKTPKKEPTSDDEI